MTGSLYAQNTKIDKVVTPIKKDLIDTIENNKKTSKADKETETIISFMSSVDNESIKTLFKERGYKKTGLDAVKQEEKDSALYETIRELNVRYGNPKITPKWSTTFNGKNYRGQFSPIKNTIHINPRIYNDKQEMIVIRLAELSHAKQYQQKGMIGRIVKDAITWTENDFTYKKLYDKEGTIEYEAHKIIEPEIYLEFVEYYLSKIDSADSKDTARAEHLIDYLVNNMKSDAMDKRAIQHMSKIREDLCKKYDIMRSKTFNDIIQDIKKYIKEIQNVQAGRNED
ncbi:MAG: hypothetical protein WC875_03275 [Candidatus Absconditabacterales bacterium]